MGGLATHSTGAEISLPYIEIKAAIIFCFLSILSLSCSMYRRVNPYLDREISGPVTVSSEWVEITPNESMKPERQIQMIIVDFATPYKTARKPDEESDGLLFSDGSIVTPEVQLVDDSSMTYNLRVSRLHSTGGGFVARDKSFQEILPKDRKYRSVRIRSEKPIQVSKIIWRCYNQEDLK